MDPQANLPNGDQIKETILQQADALTLDLKDEDLVRVLDKKIKDSKDYFKKRNLYTKQKTNKDYLLGKQWEENELQDYNARYTDNLVYESEGLIKTIVFSKFPDVYIKAGSGDEKARDDAQSLKAVFTDEGKRRDERRELTIAFKNIPIWYLGAIKARWNPEKGLFGNYEFTSIPPRYLIIDSTANTLDTRRHKMVGHYVPITIKETLMEFPDKEEALFASLQLEYPQTNMSEEKFLATTILRAEIWFDWYEQDKKDKDKWQKITAVCWKYKSVILGKMKDPNWDWEGEPSLFIADPEKLVKQQPKSDDIEQMMVDSIPGQAMPYDPDAKMESLNMPPNVSEEHKFHNHFKEHDKPFILLGYDQYGEQVYDETSRIEQGIPLQDNVNVRGRQITDMANKARGKEIFSTLSGLNKKDIENLDMNNPNIDVLVDGKVGDVHGHIPGEQPSAPMFQDQERNTERFFQKMHVFASYNNQKRGKNQAAALAQMSKEGDQSYMDDLAEEVINRAIERIADWKLQFIKLRYTKDHFVEVLGAEGESIFHRINQDSVHENMSVVVAGTAVDKQLRKQEAYNQLKLKAVDLLSFHEMADTPNPKEKAERAWLFYKYPDIWYRKYIKDEKDIDVTAAVVANAGQGQVDGSKPPEGGQTPPPKSGGQGGGEDQQQAMQAVSMLQSGQMPPVPDKPTPQFVQLITEWLKKEGPQLPPQIAEMAKQFSQAILQKIKPTSGPSNSLPTGAPQPQPMPPMAG